MLCSLYKRLIRSLLRTFRRGLALDEEEEKEDEEDEEDEEEDKEEDKEDEEDEEEECFWVWDRVLTSRYFQIKGGSTYSSYVHTQSVVYPQVFLM